MAKTPMKSAKGGLNVTVDGLEDLRKLPGMLDEGERKVLDGAAKKIGLSIASAAPGGPTGGIGRSIVTRVMTDTMAVILVTHPGAKPAERGAFRKAAPGHALRFRDGRFARWSRQRPTRFATVGLRPRSRIIKTEYRRVFDDLERSTSGTLTSS